MSVSIHKRFFEIVVTQTS